MTVAIGVFAALCIVLMLMYNGLINKKNQVENAYSGMDAMLKKRYDLIPNLVSSVGQYMKHERETLRELTELRTKALSGNLSSNESVSLNNKIANALAGIMVAVENYPELKANESFNQLQRSLNEVEEQISASRRSFNAMVTKYNNSIEMFPTKVLAGWMNYSRKEVFVIDAAERKNVDVKSLFNS
jgi:LemA protein